MWQSRRSEGPEGAGSSGWDRLPPPPTGSPASGAGLFFRVPSGPGLRARAGDVSSSRSPQLSSLTIRDGASASASVRARESGELRPRRGGPRRASSCARRTSVRGGPGPPGPRLDWQEGLCSPPLGRERARPDALMPGEERLRLLGAAGLGRRD